MSGLLDVFSMKCFMGVHRGQRNHNIN